LKAFCADVTFPGLKPPHNHKRIRFFKAEHLTSAVGRACNLAMQDVKVRSRGPDEVKVLVKLLHTVDESEL
jgi:hypothetical protein